MEQKWHVLKGEESYGPYSYSHMIQLMQEKILFSFDYAWAPHLPAWMPLADIPEFSPERIAQQLQQEGELKKVLFRREHERYVCENGVLVTDQSRMWEGRIKMISAGGALLEMENPALLPHQVVQVHVKSSPLFKEAFNCRMQIGSKGMTKDRLQHNTLLPYTAKFVQFSPGAEDRIKEVIEYLKKKAS